MACASHRRSAALAPTKQNPVIGENGFMLIEYVGEEPPETLYGEVTNAAYPFDENATRFVDLRDAVYFLGRDFIEIE